MKFNPGQWMTFICTVVGLVLGLAGYSHSTFQTHKQADSDKGFIVKRLDRIEAKLDRLLKP